MEEFFLSTFFTDNKLDVINKQDIIIPVLVPELGHSGFIAGSPSIFKGLDQFIGKSLACDIQYLLFSILI